VWMWCGRGVDGVALAADAPVDERAENATSCTWWGARGVWRVQMGWGPTVFFAGGWSTSTDLMIHRDIPITRHKIPGIFIYCHTSPWRTPAGGAGAVPFRCLRGRGRRDKAGELPP
jgi:hypothetical protein